MPGLSAMRVRAFFKEDMKELLALYKKVTGNYRPLLNGERYLTDMEVSEILKVSRRTLQEYRNEGILPYIPLGGKILYRESDLEGNPVFLQFPKLPLFSNR